ncbi:MAG: tellurite resistance TerB family protein [Ectothiorhodospiraceae bacterium]|nr:tellurite resistance TerB family protein [Chromatiales bacterium]MCP5157042.1 tellurite resistance TerB family protein [Ectothiorhodospiraceae bacterium]
MSTQGFLDQLLRTAQSALGSSGLTEQRQGGGTGLSDLGKGALAGGALGLLLGNKRLRKMGGNVALYGGVAALGALAYKAYGEWQRGQAGAPAAPPRTVDRLPGAEAEQHSRAILKALIAAAKADGHVDARERGLIEDEMGRLAASDPQLREWLAAELERPLDPAEVASVASTPELAAEMYLASLLAVDDQSYMERAYLDELARRMGIDDGLRQRLEAQVRGIGA